MMQTHQTKSKTGSAKRRWPWAVACLLALAGCGGGSDSGSVLDRSPTAVQLTAEAQASEVHTAAADDEAKEAAGPASASEPVDAALPSADQPTVKALAFASKTFDSRCSSLQTSLTGSNFGDSYRVQQALNYITALGGSHIYGKLDGDSIKDLITIDTTGVVCSWKGAEFTQQFLPDQPAEWRAVGSSYLTTFAKSCGVSCIDWYIASNSNVDFNGDGRMDLFFRNRTNSATSIWLMNNGVITTSLGTGVMSNDWGLSAFSDFNADRKTDIVWRNSKNGSVYIWLLNGATISSQGEVFRIPLEYKIAAVGDINRDGRADLFWVNPTSGVVGTWFMNGLTVAANPTNTLPNIGANSPWYVTRIETRTGTSNPTAVVHWRNNASGAPACWLFNGTTYAGGC
jgi:FG-GAP-like repeat